MSYCDKAAAVEGRLDALITQAGPEPANTAAADITATGVKSVDFKTVPGGTAAAGVLYSGMAFGTVTNGASAPTSIVFYLYWGGIAGVQILQFSLPAAGLVAGASNLGWKVTWDVAWQSATEATAVMEVFWHTGSGPGNSQPWLVTSDTTGLATSADENLTLAASWGGGSGTTIHTHASHITRRG